MAKGRESFAQRLFDWFTGQAVDGINSDDTLVFDPATAEASAVEVSDEPAALPKRYEIIKAVGRGAYGVVFLARDLRIGRLLAVKQLNTRFTPNTVIYRRFIQEARIAGQIDNPNIVTIYDVEDDRVPCILMEYLSGGNLETLIRLDAPMDELSALEFLRGIMNGLRAAHATGVVHRDIKPQNIVFDQKGTPKISDFGIASMPPESGGVDDKSEKRSLIIGTPDYMAPEQMRPDLQTADPRADLYSCGLMFYEMLTGERWHNFGKIRSPKELLEILEKATLPSDSQFPQQVSERSRILVRRLIRKDRNLRFPDAQAVIDEIDDIVAGHSGIETLAQPVREEPTVIREMFADILRLFLVDGVISAAERRELTMRACRLEIEPAEALELEENVRREFNLPSLRHLQEYAWRTEKLMEDRDFSEDDRKILDELSRAYQISDEERRKIEENVMVKLQMKEGVVEDIIP